ncbi:hypothetical protein B0H10DRAFT_2220507 [Mycena sp. CBHHK59/15]|nr:hypothetical protein B0H10DRAFT_2220507 [Mycena sp. CBHHK59/15]
MSAATTACATTLNSTNNPSFRSVFCPREVSALTSEGNLCDEKDKEEIDNVVLVPDQFLTTDSRENDATTLTDENTTAVTHGGHNNPARLERLSLSFPPIYRSYKRPSSPFSLSQLSHPAPADISIESLDAALALEVDLNLDALMSREVLRVARARLGCA